MDPLRVALRTYTLSLSLSLFPAILPVLTSPKARSPRRIRDILLRELSPSGFAFAMTLAIGGGRGLDQLWMALDRRFGPSDTMMNTTSNSHAVHRRLSPSQRTFLANILSSSAAVMLLTFTRRSRHIPIASIPLTVPAPFPRGSSTLDLTLLLFVRALDAGAQSFFLRSHTSETYGRGARSGTVGQKRLVSSVSANLDALVFWLACSRCDLNRQKGSAFSPVLVSEP